MDLLHDRAITAILEDSRSGAAAKVGLILTTRLANDLRVCVLTSYRGYGLQSLALVGTVVELVGALSYVGHSDERAVAWAEHRDLRHTYPPRVVDGIDATLATLGFADPALRDNWKKAYELMCMAKHANPFLSLLHGLRIDAGAAYHVCGPDVSDLGLELAARALWYAVGFGTFGIMVGLGHCSDTDLQAELGNDAYWLNGRLRAIEPWYLQVIRAASSPGGSA